jgi:hypothetical protein
VALWQHLMSQATECDRIRWKPRRTKSSPRAKAYSDRIDYFKRRAKVPRDARDDSIFFIDASSHRTLSNPTKLSSRAE